MAKSPDAFRTISEVADWLGIQAHVLRFWESKFTQVKPIKRAGGRRYYRPADMLLLGGIKKLLHDDGLTIKGVQKILREEGMSHVADLSAPLDELTLSQLGDEKPPTPTKPAAAVVTPKKEKGVVLNFEGGNASKSDDAAPEVIETQEEPAPTAEDAAALGNAPPAETAPQPEPEVEAGAAPGDGLDQAEPETKEDQIQTPEPAAPAAPAPPETTQTDTVPEPEPKERVSEPEAQDAKSDEPASNDAENSAPVAALPAFLRRPLVDQDVTAEKPDVPDKSDGKKGGAAQEPKPEPAAPAPKKPRIIDLPALTAEADFPATPAALTSAFRARKIAPENADKAATLLRQLTALRDSMSARRRTAAPPPSQD